MSLGDYYTGFFLSIHISIPAKPLFSIIFVFYFILIRIVNLLLIDFYNICPLLSEFQSIDNSYLNKNKFYLNYKSVK